jgi:hypothetical protein
VTDLFEQVHRVLNGDKRHEWFDCDCPFCGKEAKRGQVHFSYNSSGYHCFVCGSKGGIVALAERLNVRKGDYIAPRREPQPEKPLARWRLNPTALVDRYLHHEQRFERWQGYKPLTAETVSRFGFGYGRLPFQRRDTGDWYMGTHERLMVPLWQGGALVGLRGRACLPDDEGAKWMSATGSTMVPWGLEYLHEGATIWICENYVDAAWLMQVHPDLNGVALGGVSNWRTELCFRLAAHKPKLIIVCLDNDLPGQATGQVRKRLEAEWRADPKHKGVQPPPSNGERILRDLQAQGLRADLFPWGDGDPVKAGLDYLLQGETDGAL